MHMCLGRYTGGSKEQGNYVYQQSAKGTTAPGFRDPYQNGGGDTKGASTPYQAGPSGPSTTVYYYTHPGTGHTIRSFL